MKSILFVIVGLILFGSWFPFTFRPPAGVSLSDLFLADWQFRSGRGDVIANLLLYAPFGFFWLRAFDQRGWLLAIVSAAIAGLTLSLTVEIVQILIPGRTRSVVDLACNSTGAVLGAIAALLTGNRGQVRFGTLNVQPMPLFLAAAWLGYRLFPFVPTIDWQAFKDALKPLLLEPSVGGMELFRYTVSWLIFGRMLAALVPTRHTGALLMLVGGFVLFAKIPIVNQSLRLPEVLAIALAALGWSAFGHRLMRSPALLIGLTAGLVVANALLPFALRGAPGTFHWLPFYGFLGGSTEINIMSFLQKFFLYGALLWLTVQARVRLLPAALALSALMFTLELAQLMLLNRTAESTDAVIVLLVALIMKLLDDPEYSSNARSNRAARENHRKYRPLQTTRDRAADGLP